MIPMRCDDVLDAVATGGPFRRRLARLHAATCPRCAEALARHDEIVAALREVPPLSDAQRAGALAVMDEAPILGFTPVPERARRRIPVRAIGLAAAAVLIGIVLIRLYRPPVVPRPSVPSGMSLQADPQELQALRGDLDRVDRELADLKRRIELLPLRRETEALTVGLRALRAL